MITGSNGFLGAHLASRLVARGDVVRCLLRSGSEGGALASLQVERAEGDVTVPATLLSACEGIEVVFHLAGIRRGSTREAFMKVNAEGTRAVCDAMVEARARRLVLCGSLAASGPSVDQRPRLESDPFAPTEWYGESKAESERIAFSYAPRLEVTCVRPARILGPGDRENLVFFKMVKAGVRLAIGGGPRPLSMVDVEDVVELLLLLAQRKEAVGQSFFAASEETTTLEQLQEIVATTIGAHPRTLHLAPWALTAIAAAADGVSRATGRHLPLNRKLARQLLAPGWTCSPQKAKERLGFSAKRGLAESIRQSALWYQEHGWL